MSWKTLVALAACASLAGCWGNRDSGGGAASATKQPTIVNRVSSDDLPTAGVKRPSPPPSDFVGSAACASCHSDICQTFAQHPMGHSASLLPGPAAHDDVAPTKTEFDVSGNLRYRVSRRDDQILHHELRLDTQGRPVHDQSVPVSMAVGSGAHGMSYLTNRDGVLFMSPISWYAQRGGFFDLSPGYEHGSNLRFERRVRDACLQCHVGRVVQEAGETDRLTAPFFHELAIGCERCHGPGGKHVERQKAASHAAPDDSIVNPARLAPRLRESVCNQCHLHGEYRIARYGRRLADFRPGMHLDDVILAYVVGEGINASGGIDFVNQVQQMRASACFEQSAGKLGCVSCHNPHAKESAAERVNFYRERCLACHADRGCSLPQEKQNAEPAGGSCIHCHMPATGAADVAHASQTDHRILRDPAVALAGGRGIPEFDEWTLFDGAAERIPAWEARRARGMALVFAVTQNYTGKGRLVEAQDLLVPLTKILADDGPLHYVTGQSFLYDDRYEQAVEHFAKAIECEPKNDIYLEALARAHSSLGQHEQARQAIEQCLTLNPWHARNHLLHAEVLAALGDSHGALAAAERASELDPSQLNLRDRIIERLRQPR